MEVNTNKITSQLNALILTALMFFACLPLFAQKADSTRISFKPKYRTMSGLPQFKVNVQTYRPNLGKFYPTISSLPSIPSKLAEPGNRIITVLKIYPNPVVEQLNISFRLEKEAILSIKITDLLGNEIVTLTNEKAAYGEQTKTFNMPTKLTSGIYFLRIVAGGEPIIKRISVL